MGNGCCFKYNNHNLNQKAKNKKNNLNDTISEKDKGI